MLLKVTVAGLALSVAMYFVVGLWAFAVGIPATVLATFLLAMFTDAEL